MLLFAAAGALSSVLPPLVVVMLVTLAGVWLAVSVDVATLVLPLLLIRSAADSIMDLFTLFGGTPLEMNLAGALNSFTLGLGLAYAVRRWLIADHSGRRHVILGVPGVWWYLAWLLIGLAGVSASIAPLETLKEWVRLASGLALFVLARPLAANPARRPALVWAIFLAALAPLALEFFQLATGTGYFFVGLADTAYAFRAQGTFGHPAILASFLLVVVALAGALWLTPAPPANGRLAPPRRTFAFAMLVLAGIGLLLTLARAQWLGLWATVVVLLAFRRPRWLWLAILGPLALLALPPIRDRLTSTDAQDSVTWRWELWQVGVGLIDLTRVVGRGLSTFPVYVEQVLPPRYVAPPHNDYLKVLIETGILGALAWAGWQLHWLLAAARRAMTNPYALALAAVVVGGLVVSLTDNYVQYTSVQWYVWALAALAFVDSPRDGGAV
jgi:O-antigen ligase